MGYYLFNFTRGKKWGKASLIPPARELIQAGLWGITEGNQLRDRLESGDSVLLYVGAPHKAFVGWAVLDSSWHPWAPSEKERYPGFFENGVSFREAVGWDRPIPMAEVIERLDLARTNPRALFYSGVVRITRRDFETVVEAGRGRGDAPSGAPVPPPPRTQTHASASGALFTAAERVKSYLATARTDPISEEGTRSFFIDKVLDALGYTGFDDITHGGVVASGNFPDYVLHAGGRRVAAVEAKKLGHTLGPREAAQLIQYCATLGVRWGVLTNGQVWQVYDQLVLDVEPHERMVVATDIAAYRDRDDFDSTIAPTLALISKQAMETGQPLQRRASYESVRELLSSGGSKTLAALQAELDERKQIRMSRDELSDVVADLLG